MTWLTRDGTLAALVVGASVAGGSGGGWRGAALLLVFFVSGSLLTRAPAEAGRGGRNARQVVANGGVAAAAALLGSWPALAGALAAATADTWATEIGSLSRHAPRSITTWAKVARGTSGGITLPGTVGGVVGAAGIGTLAWLLGPRGAASAPEAAAVGTAVAVAGVLGMVLDSVLGATLQGEFECGACGARSERRGALCHGPVTRIKGYAWVDNDWVNLAATFSGALIALWLS